MARNCILIFENFNKKVNKKSKKFYILQKLLVQKLFIQFSDNCHTIKEVVECNISYNLTCKNPNINSILKFKYESTYVLDC